MTIIGEEMPERVARAIAGCEWDQSCSALGIPNYPRGGNWSAKLPQARAAIEAIGSPEAVTVMREALEEIEASKDHDSPSEFNRGWNAGRSRLRSIARAALLKVTR